MESRILLEETITQLISQVMADPSDLRARSELGIALHAKGDEDQAVKQLEDVLSIETDQNSEIAGIALFHLGIILSSKGDTTDSMDLFSQAYQVFIAVRGADDRYTQSALYNMEHACGQQITDEHSELHSIQAEKAALQAQLDALQAQLV